MLNGGLGLTSLHSLPASVARPAYAPDRTVVGVVHLGVGNFFRAHQAVYLDDVMNAGETGWGVCGVSLRSPATRDALAPQQGLYSVIERDGRGARARVIGSLRELLVAPEDPQRVIDRLAAPGLRWVTLTITEKGYCQEPISSHREAENRQVTGDRQAPQTAVGFLHAAMCARRDAGLPGVTLVSCDNLSANGDRLRALLHECDRQAGGGLAAWIDDKLDFPNTMVDRIVPRSTDEDRRVARQLLGVDDAWPVPVEPFSQWVIEDTFRGPRPDLGRFGVQWVSDVAPYELMKLRLLNAAHSTLAYLGVGGGWATVDVAIRVPALRRVVQTMWREEVIPALPASLRQIAGPYTDSLLSRFENPGLMHRTAQIAMDGSQKVPLRLLPSIRDNLRAGRSIDCLSLAVAAWIRYLGGVDDHGATFVPDDPDYPRLRQRLAGAADATARARAMVGDLTLFGDLADNEVLRTAVGTWLERLETQGTMVALTGGPA